MKLTISKWKTRGSGRVGCEVGESVDELGPTELLMTELTTTKSDDEGGREINVGCS